MKKIDIHTRQKLDDNENKYNKQISSESMRNYILDSIEFSMSNDQWELINKHFSEYWNHKVGIGGYFYWDEVSSYVYKQLRQDKQVISQNRVDFIVELILSKIEKDGGFME